MSGRNRNDIFSMREQKSGVRHKSREKLAKFYHVIKPHNGKFGAFPTFGDVYVHDITVTRCGNRCSRVHVITLENRRAVCRTRRACLFAVPAWTASLRILAVNWIIIVVRVGFALDRQIQSTCKLNQMKG